MMEERITRGIGAELRGLQWGTGVKKCDSVKQREGSIIKGNTDLGFFLVCGGLVYCLVLVFTSAQGP